MLRLLSDIRWRQLYTWWISCFVLVRSASGPFYISILFLKLATLRKLKIVCLLFLKLRGQPKECKCHFHVPYRFLVFEALVIVQIDIWHGSRRLEHARHCVWSPWARGGGPEATRGPRPPGASAPPPCHSYSHRLALELNLILFG